MPNSASSNRSPAACSARASTCRDCHRESCRMASDEKTQSPQRRFRSRDWFDDPKHLDMVALYLERFMNYGLTANELLSGKPIIGIAQTGGDLTPCNRVHLDTVKRVREGIRDAGGVPMEFPLHPIFENCRRPTAALDRNLAYLGLVEILHGYPIDAVVLTTGCDKTTPAQIMAASTVDIPAIVLSGGPMLDGWHDGDLVGSGTVIWRSRRKLAAGQINEKQFLDAAAASAPSLGHCNTMGTASTMNAVAEVLGLSLPGCAAIPAPYRERGQISYETGRRIVEMAYEDLRPSKILTRAVFPQCHHRHRRHRRLDQCAAAPGRHGAPRRHRNHAARLDGVRPRHSAAREHAARRQVSGRAFPSRRRRARGAAASCCAWARSTARRSRSPAARWPRTSTSTSPARGAVDREVITTYEKPVQEKAGFLVLKGNLFDFAIMKTSVISPEFRKRYLGDGDSFECRAVVFDGSDGLSRPHQRSVARHRREHHPRDPRARARWAGRARRKS